MLLTHSATSLVHTPSYRMLLSASAVLLLLAPVALSQGGACPPSSAHCRYQNWHLGIDRVRPSGAVVHGHASTAGGPGVQGTVHGSHVFGGPHNGAQSVGGGLNYQHSNGLHGAVDATHHRGQGTSYSGSVGGSTQVGPGTLSVGGGASSVPGSSKVQGQVGATYSIP